MSQPPRIELGTLDDPEVVFTEENGTLSIEVDANQIELNDNILTNAGSVSTGQLYIGTSPTQRPLVSNEDVILDAGEFPTDDSDTFNAALETEIPWILRHNFDLLIPDDDSLADIDVKLPPIYRVEHAEEPARQAAADFRGDRENPTGYKVGSVYVKSGGGWAWAVLGAEIQRANPYGNDDAGIAFFETMYGSVVDCVFAGGVNGILSYGSTVESVNNDFGTGVLSGWGLGVKHGGWLHESKREGEISRGRVGAEAYRPEEGFLLFDGMNSTLSGDLALVNDFGEKMMGMAFDYSANRWHNIHVLKLNPQDVRGVPNASYGDVAFHDGSGTDNTTGPAHHDGEDWISTVDGSTIS